MLGRIFLQRVDQAESNKVAAEQIMQVGKRGADDFAAVQGGEDGPVDFRPGVQGLELAVKLAGYGIK